MRFSQSELELIGALAKTTNMNDLAKQVSKSKSQLYKTFHNLEQKAITRDNQPTKQPHTTLLLQLLSKYPNIKKPLSGAGIQVLQHLQTPKTAQQLTEVTRLHKTTVHKKLSQARKASLIQKKSNQYQLNNQVWPQLSSLLKAIQLLEQTTDHRIPAEAIIYHKTDKEILFSTIKNVSATKTAFSRYNEHNIPVQLLTQYYYLPEKVLTKQEILDHSLYICEKEHDVRKIIFTTLFYHKYKKELHSKHEIITNVANILRGATIQGYPKKQEIHERAQLYNIKM